MKEVHEYFTIYKQSAWTKNPEHMISLYDENVVIFDMWEHGYLSGLEGWSNVIRSWLGNLGEENVNVIFDMVEVHDNTDIAFGSALITYQAISMHNVVLRSMRNRITLGFIKKKGEWKVIHQHTSAPINAELHAILSF
jgi:ketosteroid isomerase-like protein